MSADKHTALVRAPGLNPLMFALCAMWLLFFRTKKAKLHQSAPISLPVVGIIDHDQQPSNVCHGGGSVRGNEVADQRSLPHRNPSVSTDRHQQNFLEVVPVLLSQLIKPLQAIRTVHGFSWLSVDITVTRTAITIAPIVRGAE